MYLTKCSRASRRKNSGRDLFPPFFLLFRKLYMVYERCQIRQKKIAEITPAGITTIVARDGQKFDI